jgi:hypothetical protein
VLHPVPSSVYSEWRDRHLFHTHCYWSADYRRWMFCGAEEAAWRIGVRGDTVIMLMEDE